MAYLFNSPVLRIGHYVPSTPPGGVLIFTVSYTFLVVADVCGPYGLRTDKLFA